MTKTTKKIFLMFMLLIPLLFILFYPNTPSTNALEINSATVIASKCNIYTEANFTSEKVASTDDYGQPVIITLNLGDTVDVIEFDGDFAKVSIRGSNGWVYKYYLTQNSSQDVYPVFNGTIKNDTIIHNMDKQSIGKIAKENSRVFIFEGYDSNAEWTAVQLILEDGSLYSGYISTSDVEADGVSKVLIVAITIIAAAVTIILSLIFIRKKGKKKKQA